MCSRTCQFTKSRSALSSTSCQMTRTPSAASSTPPSAGARKLLRPAHDVLGHCDQLALFVLHFDLRHAAPALAIHARDGVMHRNRVAELYGLQEAQLVVTG